MMFSEAFVCIQGGVSVRGVFVQGVSVRGVSVWGSLSGGLCPGGSLLRGLCHGDPHPHYDGRAEERAVRILLTCILFLFVNKYYIMQGFC